jgi:hypothetical protein
MFYTRTSPNVSQYGLIYKSSKLFDLKVINNVDQDVP